MATFHNCPSIVWDKEEKWEELEMGTLLHLEE